MNTSIRAFSLTLRELLTQQLKADLNLRDFFDPAHGGTMVVSLLAPDEFAPLGQEGVSLWLYRVVRDEQTLNLPPVRRARDRLLPVPLPLKLHYLAVPVVNVSERRDGPELQQNIMGAVLQIFHDHGTLRGSDFRGDLAGSPLDIHMRLETLDLDQLSRLWDAIEQSYQLCVSYEAAVIPIDSALESRDTASVDVVLPEYGLATQNEETV